MKRLLCCVLLLGALGFAQKPTRPKPSSQVIANQKRIAELESALAAERQKLAEANRQTEELRAGFRDLLADTDALASAGKNLVQEYQRLTDRYNDLVRDYNNVVMQTQTTFAQLRIAADQQAQACRSAARQQALANWMNSIPKFQTPSLAPYVPPPQIKTMFQCTTRNNGAFGGYTTTCQ